MNPSQKELMSEAWFELIQNLEQLRGPQGCPWDRKQTFESLKPYLIEEAYEVLEAIDQRDVAAMKEEWGDVLLQVVFHAQIGAEEKQFDLLEIVQTLNAKLRRRHPHVFGDRQFQDEATLRENWEALKAQERKQKGKESLLDEVPQGLPALTKAYRLGSRAAQVKFDWPFLQGILDKIQEELAEVQQAIAEQDSHHIEEELGDVLFSVAQLARGLKIHPEEALQKACRKFIDRFQWMEKQAQSEQKVFSELSLEQLEALWGQAKNALKPS